jgi:hypothetical protein
MAKITTILPRVLTFFAFGLEPSAFAFFLFPFSFFLLLRL